MLFSCSEKKQTISGKLNNLGDTEIILNKYTQSGIVEVAKTKAVEGKFSLEYSPEEPTIHFIKTEKFNVPVFLDMSSISISGDADTPAEILVEGSESDAEYKEFEKVMIPLSDEQMSLRNQYRDYSAKGDKQNMTDIYEEFEAIQIKMMDEVKNHIRENNDTYLSAFLANLYFGNSEDMEELESLFTTLDESLEGYSPYDNLKSTYETKKSLVIGGLAPDFTLNDTEGKPVSLSSFRGKYILLDFWASWCAPCRQANPHIVATYTKFAGEEFDILAVSLDKSKENWIKAIGDDKLTWTHVSDLKYWQSDVAKLYNVTAIPFNLLLDPDGKIVAKNLIGAELDAKLASLIN